MYGKSSMWPRGQTDHEPRRDERAVAVTALVRVEAGGEPVVVVETLALRAGVPAWEPHHGDVVAVAGRRNDESADAEFALETRLVQVRVADRPSVDTGDHERLVPECDDRADAVGGDQLAAPDGALDAASVPHQEEVRFLIDVAQRPEGRECADLGLVGSSGVEQQRLVDVLEGAVLEVADDRRALLPVREITRRAPPWSASTASGSTCPNARQGSGRREDRARPDGARPRLPTSLSASPGIVSRASAMRTAWSARSRARGENGVTLVDSTCR